MNYLLVKGVVVDLAPQELINMDESYFDNLKNSSWPQEFREKLRIGNIKSNVGIACLWSFQEIVARNLDSEKYAVLGNFYDKRNALEPFIRNCLANPNLRYVILIGNDKSQSRSVLVNFFEKGFDESGKIIDSDSFVPRGIPSEDINKLRENVKLIDVVDKVSNLDDSDEYAKVIESVLNGLEKLEPYDSPKLYEKPALNTDSYPGESSGFLIRSRTVGETWLKLLKNIYDYGAVTKMKTNDSTQVRECVNLMAVVEDEDPDSPNMEEYFRFDEAYLKDYYNEICSSHLPEGTLYTYGSRLRAWQGKNEGKEDVEKIDQIQDIIEYLKKDTYRKSAVAITWIVEDELTRRYLNKDKNSPCIDLVQPNIQDGKLHFTVYIRSNDMFRAWPLNAFGLRKLQKTIAEGLGVDMGSLTTISCSAHIYQDNWDETKELLEKYLSGTNCFYDPRGYYIINLKSGKIFVEHYSADSRLLKEYTGLKAREINDQINSSQHPIDSYHSSYLGEELMKAEIALKLGIEYIQDKSLEFSKASDVCDVSCETSDSNGSCSDDSCAV